MRAIHIFVSHEQEKIKFDYNQKYFTQYDRKKSNILFLMKIHNNNKILGS